MKVRVVPFVAILVVAVVAFVGCGPSLQTPYNAGLDLQSKAQYKAAIDKYNEFIKMYPDSSLVSTAMVKIGECYEGMYDKPRAMEMYDKVIAQKPNDAKNVNEARGKKWAEEVAMGKKWAQENKDALSKIDLKAPPTTTTMAKMTTTTAAPKVTTTTAAPKVMK